MENLNKPNVAQSKKRKLCLLVDTREHLPYIFSHLVETVHGYKLETGDYSVENYTDAIAVERKTLNDFFSSITHQRDRFFREILRLSMMPHACIVVESSWEFIERGNYDRRISINSIQGTVQAIIGNGNYGVPVYFLPDRQRAIEFTERYLVNAAACLDAEPKFSTLEVAKKVSP